MHLSRYCSGIMLSYLAAPSPVNTARRYSASVPEKVSGASTTASVSEMRCADES